MSTDRSLRLLRGTTTVGSKADRTDLATSTDKVLTGNASEVLGRMAIAECMGPRVLRAETDLANADGRNLGMTAAREILRRSAGTADSGMMRVHVPKGRSVRLKISGVRAPVRVGVME